jgi:hypothetical protein
MSRSTKFDVDRAHAREKLYQLREQVLGVGVPDVRHWSETLPPHPASARERFLQICAMGGAECFEAAMHGVVLRPHNIRNSWIVSSGDPDERVGGSYQLHLWIRPGGRGESTRPHTARGCGAELHDSWATVSRNPKRRTRRGHIIHRGTLSQCLGHAKVLFTSWDATRRLGGKPEPLVLF